MKKLRHVVDVGNRHAWLWRNRPRFVAQAGPRPRRLLIDVSTIIRHDAQTGIQRVVRAVWSELAKRNGSGFEILPVYASHTHGYLYASDAAGVPGRGNTPVGLGRGDIFLGLDLSAHVIPKYARQIRAWRANGGHVAVVVYDLLPLERPDWFTPAGARNFARWMNLLRDDVDQAFCISDHVSQQLTDRLDGSNGPTIARLMMGADIAASRPTSGICDGVAAVLQRSNERPTILMVGTVEPRKGYDDALAALDHFWSDGHDADLVIVGKAGWNTSALQDRIRNHPEFGSRLWWLREVSDEGLQRLYDAASGILIASRGEGFGLPLVEAASHRRHVLARNLPVFQEQRLPNVRFFDSAEPSALSSKIRQLLQSADDPPEVRLPNWSDAVDRLLFDLGLWTRASAPPAKLLRQA